jgi:hypothetical protein
MSAHGPVRSFTATVIRTVVSVASTRALGSVSQAPWKYSTSTVEEAGDDRTRVHGTPTVVVDGDWEHPASNATVAMTPKLTAVLPGPDDMSQAWHS